MPEYIVVSIERELRRVTHRVTAETPEEAETAVKDGDDEKASYIGSEHEDTLEYVRTASITEVTPIAIGDTVRLLRFADGDVGDEACPVVPGITGKVIEDPDGLYGTPNTGSVCVEWAMPINPQTWSVPIECVVKVSI